MLAYVPNQYNIVDVKVRYSTDEDKANLIPMDHSMLSAMDTCPTWGSVRMVNMLQMPHSGRALALEAGSVCHDGFALVRWYQWRFMESKTIKEETRAEDWFFKEFGTERATEIRYAMSDKASHHTNVKNMCEAVVLTSGYYDDDYDKRRTVSNLIDALSHYCDMWDFDRYPVWIGPNNEIGIEVGFDLTMELSVEAADGVVHIHTIRFCGKIDGFHMDRGEHVIHENKTGARLDDAWLAQWEMSHQITGYCFAASHIMGQPIHHARIMGLRIPIGRDRMDGLRQERVPRNPLHYTNWLRWMFEKSVEVARHKDNPLQAPRYTQSCNRYFRPCGLLPLCTLGSLEEQQEMLGEMEKVRYAPWEDQG